MPEKKELSKSNGPVFSIASEETFKLIMGEFSKVDIDEDFNVQKEIIYYPSIDGEVNPLSRVHVGLLDAPETDGFVAGFLSTTTNESLIYFAISSDNGDPKTILNTSIDKANDDIAILGGNNFIPKKIA